MGQPISAKNCSLSALTNIILNIVSKQVSLHCVFKSFVLLNAAKKLKKECERIARKFYIYIIAAVVIVVSFGWIRKKSSLPSSGL